MIDDPRIRGVALTGGVAAARGVAERAGKNVKKSTMELCGSDAFIVLEDADLDKTLTWALWAKMNNMGQCCIAGKRFIVVEALADRFLGKFKAAMEALKPGDPMDPGTTLGPLSTEAALVQLVKQVDDAFVLRVPGNLDPAGAAPLLCAGITTYSPLRHHGVSQGQKVGVVGLGGLGHMGVKLAKALGAHVVVFTTSLGKVEDALRLGADEVVHSKDETAMKKHLNSFHFILDTVGAKHDINAYLVLLKRDGKLTSLETVVAGLDHAADAFIGLFDGRNVGKMVVELSSLLGGRLVVLL